MVHRKEKKHMETADKIFQLEAEFTNTLKNFKEHYLFPESNLITGIASYISKKNYIDGSADIAARVLIALYEAFKRIKDSPNFDLSKFDYCFSQSREQLVLNTKFNIYAIDAAIKYLNELGFFSKCKKNKQGSNNFSWNYEKMIEMFRYLGKEYLEESKEDYKEYKKVEDTKKEKAKKKKTAREEYWEAVNEITKKPFNMEILDLFTKYDIDVKQADIMMIISRGILHYRNTFIEWNDANFNTLFGEKSLNSISFNKNSVEDSDRLFAACNPEFESKTYGVTSNMHITNKICAVYKYLANKDYLYNRAFEDANVDDINDYLVEKSIKAIN